MNLNVINRNSQTATMEAHIACRRKALTIAIANLLLEIGVDSAEKQVLESLTELLQSLIYEIGNSSRAYCELAGRTEPVIGDVVIAMINMGLSLEGIEAHAMRPGRSAVQTLGQSTQPKQLNILQAGVKQSPPGHIPSHLPAFPDPHAYIRTPTHKQPVTEYEAIREKAACQKRDIERALTRFVAKTGDTHSLFLTEDSNIFPLIACKPQHPPYLKALLPLDQVFEFEEELSGPTPENNENNKNNNNKNESNESSASNSQSQRSRHKSKHQPQTQSEHEDFDEEGGQNKDQQQQQQQQQQTSEETNKSTATHETDIIDNPYLRPVKMPRKKLKK